MLSSILTGVFVFCVVVGALLGLWRGMGKSIIRFISVICAAIVAIFCTPLLTEAVLKIDISSMGLAADSTARTVEETLMYFLQSISGVGELMAISPTLKSLVVAIPMVFVNLLLFVILFFVLKAILYIFYKIVSKIALPKLPKGQPLKLRWVGIFVGAIQGIVVFAVMMIPFTGAVNLVESEMDYYNSYRAEAQAEIQASSVSLTAVGETSTDVVSEEPEESQTIPFAEIETYTSEFSSNWTFKFLNAIGYDSISRSGFNNLTKMKVGTETTTLANEFDAIVKIAVRIERVGSVELAKMTEEEISIFKEIVSLMFDSVILGNSTSELISGVAGAWVKAEPTEFLSMAKPDIGGSAVQMLDTLLLNLKADTKAELEADLLATCDLLSVFVENGIIGEISGSEESGDSLNTFGADGVVSDVIDCMVKGKALKNTIPAFVQCGLDLVVPSLGIPATQDDVTVEDRLAKQAIFCSNIAKASNAYSGDDTQLRQDYLDAFLLIGLRGYEIEIYVEEMVGNRDSLCTIEDVAEYIIENGYGDGRMKKVEPQFVTQEDLKIVRSASQINWETEKVVLNNIFVGFSKVSESLDAEGEDVENIDYKELGLVFDNIQESQLLDGVDQKLMICLLDSSFFDAVEVGQNLMLRVRDPQEFEEIDFASTFVGIGNSVKLAKEFSEIADPSGERTDFSPDTVTSLLEGLQQESVSDIVQDFASKENLVNAGATESQADAISGVIDVLSSDTTESLPQTDAEKETEAGAVQSLITTIESVNGRADVNSNIFASQEEANTFIDNLMRSSYVYSLTINNGVKLGFLSENDTDPVTYTSLLSAEDKAFVENALNNSAYSSASNQAKTVEIANKLFGMDNYVYGGDNY